MIPTLYRFHGHNSLRFVYANGKAVRSQLCTIKYVTNAHRRHSRFSVVVSKKVIKSAVARNRIRRRIYEYVRLSIPRLHSVHDIVIICTSADFRVMPAAELTDQLTQLFDKASLFKAPEN